MSQLLCSRLCVTACSRSLAFSSLCSKTGAKWKLSRWYTTHSHTSTQPPGSPLHRIWNLTQRAIHHSTSRTSKSPGLKFILGPAVLTVSARLFCRVACCEADVNNNTAEEVILKDSVPDFKWHILWEFVKPQLFALIGAVVLAFGAAILNIQIPLMLGDLVNVVARYLREHSGTYVNEIKGPAMKLLGLYAIQGLLTTGYIILLSRVGERVAGDMRKTLFASLIRQDVAFFDANKTGQLVNRLTADIQEFKSSFKLVISQGLRSITQTVGCFVSLYIISPKLTGLTVVVLPCLVGAGALIGSFLRKLSRLAQEQVLKHCSESPHTIEVLLNAYSHLKVTDTWVESVPEDALKEHKDFYESIFSLAMTPRSLQHLARCRIRSFLEGRVHKVVPKLNLPTFMKDYLLLNCRGYVH